MADTSSYSALLSEKSSDVILDTDAQWRQFVSDHRTYLKSIAPTYTPSSDELNRYEYNLCRYLRNNGFNPAIMWVILLINDLDTEFDFYLGMTNPTLYIPTYDTLVDLHDAYLSTLSNATLD